MNPRMTEISFFRGVFDMVTCVGVRSQSGSIDPWGITATDRAIPSVGS
jgi:hypothetical protein